MPAAAPIALGATLLSGAVGAAGSIITGGAQAAAANYNAQIAQASARQASTAATTALAQGTVAAQRDYQLGAEKMGAIRAAFGANNIEENGGSALNVQESEARTTALNVAGDQYNANAQATGYLNQGRSDAAQAGLDRMQASNDTTTGIIGAGTSVLGAVSQVASRWKWMQGPQTPTPAAATAVATNDFDGSGTVGWG